MRIVRRSTVVFYGLLSLILGVAGAVIGREATSIGAWLGLVPPVVLLWLGLRRPLRRWRVARRGLPGPARAWLERHVPFYAGLEAAEKARFERDVQFVLDEWTFEPVQGVTLRDEHRWGVAAGAALLLHGRADWELSARHTVLFYPGMFDEDYRPTDEAAFDGMAHEQGPVIVSIQALEHSWADPTDGSNVVLHELAHLLDYLNTGADGVPALLDPGSHDAWRRLVRREMRRAALGRSVLRRYAATNPAEFFAVAVENFFERPAVLRKRHRELFDALVAFFDLDPGGGRYDDEAGVDDNPAAPVSPRPADRSDG